MSRYDTKVEIYGETFDVSYGHDHATGYFVQVYHPSVDNPVIDIDELFGATVGQRPASQDVFLYAQEIANKTFNEVRSGEITTERMDRDPENHLGARLAAQMMPTSGSA
jgi:hypothetical protein